MAEPETDDAKKPLAVLKVLHRNATRLGEFGRTKETLKPVSPSKLPSDTRGGEQLRDVTRKAVQSASEPTPEAKAAAAAKVMAEADATFAASGTA